MKTLRLFLFTWLLVASAGNSIAQPASQRDSVLALIQSVRPNPARATAPDANTERPDYTLTPGGAVRSLSTPPGMHVAGPGGPPEIAARQFVKQNAQALGIVSPAVDFQLKKKNSGRGRHSVRLTQTYAGVPVFGGEMVVQFNDAGGVEFFSGNFDRDTVDLDTQRPALRPKLTQEEARAVALAHYAGHAAGQALMVTTPELTLFVPSLLKLSGPKRLTWKLEVRSADQVSVAWQAFFDAQTGEFVQQIPLIYDALDRKIYDANSSYTVPGTLVRTDGQPPCGIPDADLAYTNLADTYQFFASQFDRDGYDNMGSTLHTTVRYPVGAAWNGNGMVLQNGWAFDDVVAHEFTHGVTGSESGLIYLNESGAINESLSDVFGEFVDLTNASGSNDPTNRWLLFEDSPAGVNRSMKNPPAIGAPDWPGSTNYVAPNGPDNGGVHSNSGVNNKLCYLLTDGDTFRGFNVVGMGISNVAELYYEANANLLVSSSGWIDLADALRQSAINLGWSPSQRVNLDAALAAVGILIQDFYLDENSASLCPQTGHAACDGVSGIGPAKSFPVAFSLMPTNITARLFVAGTAHTNRIARPVRIQSWSGNARITP